MPVKAQNVAMAIVLVGFSGGVLFAVYPLFDGDADLGLYNWIQFCGGMLTIVAYTILCIGLT